ncbi:MAG TPA: ABC transporter permease [Acidobacteriaceae bacterium]|nr:ABC transporter permease [Acidobacteriaceae bacterium]
MSDSVLAAADIQTPIQRHPPADDFSQYKELLFMLTWRDIKIRYKQSVMGFAWAVLMPILIVGSGLIVTIAFSTISRKPINQADILSVAIKAVPWAFFVGAIRFATNSLIMNRELVTKIYFPRQILPLASVLASLFDFAVAATVLVLVCLGLRIGGSIYLLWLPVLLVLLILISASIGILFACANLFFRDVKYLVEVLLTYGIFFTPVFYSPHTLGKWGNLLLLNPVGPVLQGLSDVIVLRQSPSLPWVAYSAVWAILGFIASWKIFQAAEPLFAESI